MFAREPEENLKKPHKNDTRDCQLGEKTISLQ